MALSYVFRHPLGGGDIDLPDHSPAAPFSGHLNGASVMNRSAELRSSALVIDLSTLSSAQGFIIQGDAAGDRAGWSVSSAGEVNGDGFDDLMVGAPFGDDGGGSAGEAYVIFGKHPSSGGFGTTVGGRQVLDLSPLSKRPGLHHPGRCAG